jgi:uncharacterized protein (TIGR03083 family)
MAAQAHMRPSEGGNMTAASTESPGDTPGQAPTGPTLAALVDVLGTSVERLAALVEPLTPAQLRQQAYPTEWTVADVLSHLGSGAVLTRLRFEGDTNVDPQPIWDEWNAKDPDAQAADALEADAALQRRLTQLTADDAATLRFAMGPMELDLVTFLGLRLNEHSLHTWDIAVTFDPSATVPADEAALVVDTLGMMARFAGKPTGADRDITLRTTAPARQFQIGLRPDGVALAPHDQVDEPDLELPTDALVRLVFGRLDPDHSPVVANQTDLDELRRAFPGF